MNPPAQTGCIPLETLATHLRGQTSQEQQLIVNQHLASGCPMCATNERWLAKAFRVAAADHSFAVPSSAIAKVIAHFKEQTARPPLQQWLAQLIFDSFTGAQLAPARQAAVSGAPGSRQMLYRAAGFGIDLRFEQAEGEAAEELLGQVTTDDPAQSVDGLGIQLWREGELVTETMTEAGGYFNLAPLPSGTYVLRLQVSAGEIQINGVSTAHGAKA